MILNDILQTKGSFVLTTVPEASLETAAELLMKHNFGALVVCESGDPTRIVGIISERDMLHACATEKATLDQLRVEDVMTREVVPGYRSDLVQTTMGVMTEKRIRHLPIIEDGRLLGLISIGDIVKAQHQLLTSENYFLKSYIQS